MIENFEKNKHILTELKNVENVKKSKNREHFIISVLKVGQVKKNIFMIFVRFHVFFKILNHRWRWLDRFHQLFGASEGS